MGNNTKPSFATTVTRSALAHSSFMKKLLVDVSRKHLESAHEGFAFAVLRRCRTSHDGSLPSGALISSANKSSFLSGRLSWLGSGFLFFFSVCLWV